jgi:hypothetical protein
MTHPPAVPADGVEGALDFVLRSSTHPAATGKGKPVPRVEAETYGNEQENGRE